MKATNRISAQVCWTLIVGAVLVSACGGAQGQQPAAAAGEEDEEVVVVGPQPEPPKIDPLPAMDVTPATGKPAPDNNPFEGAEFYVNPEYAKKIAETKVDDPAVKAKLAKLKTVPTGLWLDRIAAIEQLPKWLDDAAKQTKKKKKPVVPVVVVYDLPNRDCSAKASAGELSIDQGGEERYRKEFIDPIAAEFAKRPDQRIVVVLEPDSLPNMATNLAVEKCAKSALVYENSVAYAISKLSLPNVYIYVDAAHAGWLGWIGNRNRYARLMKQVLEKAGGVDRIRGFATNTSNYNALEGEWGKELEPTNPAPNELAYVEALGKAMDEEGVPGRHFMVDTSRNGVQQSRTKWGNWCNVAKAGIGERPQIDPKPRIDAYFWVKPPGESDGVADRNATRFDENCASPDARPDAPEAGQWFPTHLIDMVKAANPPL